MHKNSKIVNSLTPRVPKVYLLLIAALVWTFAGVMLEYKGYSFLEEFPNLKVLKISGCLVGGLLFFKFVFTRISKKHVGRIVNLEIDKPCLFSFFNLKSYLMMGIMISTGIILRTSGIVSHEYLSIIYITMGVPLIMSSFRFYYQFIKMS